MFPLFLEKGPRTKWTIYNHESYNNKKCLSVGNFGILSVFVFVCRTSKAYISLCRGNEIFIKKCSILSKIIENQKSGHVKIFDFWNSLLRNHCPKSEKYHINERYLCLVVHIGSKLLENLKFHLNLVFIMHNLVSLRYVCFFLYS